jgi:hypothetical protein
MDLVLPFHLCGLQTASVLGTHVRVKRLHATVAKDSLLKFMDLYTRYHT